MVAVSLKNSPIRTHADVDQPQIRVAVGKGSAYDLFLTRELKAAQIVRAPTSPAVVQKAREAGCHGYVVKGADVSELARAIRGALNGQPYYSSEVLDAASASNPIDRLSGREREVLQLIAEGRTNREIADMLTVSIKTVQAHRAHIMEKLNVHDKTDLVKYAIRMKLINAE